MRVLTTIILTTIMTTGCASTSSSDFERRIDEILERSSVDRIGIAYYDLDGGTTWFLNENEIFHAASTMKVPVMIGLFRAIDAGELSLGRPVPVVNEFESIYDGSTFSLERDRDSDPELYDRVGETLPLENLIERMIVRSSNLATNIVIELVGAARIMEVMEELGATDMNVLRGVEDMKAFDHGMNNTATAHDLMVVLREIARRASAGDPAARSMIDILAHQEFNEGIPAGLPDGIRVAHKTGSITEIYHDAAIVYPPDGGPYVLVVLTGGTSDDDASETVAAISELIWEHRSGL